MAAEALEQSVLESKDKDQLLAIAKALGVKASARTKKSDIIDQILESTGSAVARRANGDVAVAGAGVAAPTATVPRPHWPTLTSAGRRSPSAVSADPGGAVDEPPAEWELEVGAAGDGADRTATPGGDAATDVVDERHRRPPTTGLVSSPGRAPRRPRRTDGRPAGPGAAAQGGDRQGHGRVGRWRGGRREPQPAPPPAAQGRRPRGRGPAGRRRGARRGRDRRAARQRAGRGGGVPRHARRGLRLPARQRLPASRDDAYIPVKLARQYGLRKGDHVTGAEPAGRAQREEPGAARDPHRQRRRPGGGQAPASVRGSDGAVPRREAAARGPGRSRPT